MWTRAKCGLLLQPPWENAWLHGFRCIVVGNAFEMVYLGGNAALPQHGIGKVTGSFGQSREGWGTFHPTHRVGEGEGH